MFASFKDTYVNYEEKKANLLSGARKADWDWKENSSIITKLMLFSRFQRFSYYQSLQQHRGLMCTEYPELVENILQLPSYTNRDTRIYGA